MAQKARPLSRYLAIGLALSLGLSACEHSEVFAEGELPFPEARSSKGRALAPKPSSNELEKLSQGNVDLSFELIRRLNENNQNLAVSARSLRSAFGQVLPMARGDTQRSILKGLNFLEDSDKTLKGLNYIGQTLASRNLEEAPLVDAVEIEEVNRLFLDKSISPGSKFLDTLAEHFGTGVSLVDFEKDAPEILKEINEWVSHHTRERIPKLLDQKIVHTRTSWLLVNALYVQAPWAKAMAGSSKNNFTTLDGEMTIVPTMVSKPYKGSYGEHEGGVWGLIPLRGGDLNFFIYAPKEGDFEAIRQNFDSTTLRTLLENGKKKELIATLPTFELRSAGLNIKQALMDMGMKTPFSGNADYRGLTDGQQNAEGLGAVVQEVYFSATKDGIEAAAATTLAVQKSKLAPEEPFKLEITRPFLFALLDAPTGVALFAGQVTDPRKK